MNRKVLSIVFAVVAVVAAMVILPLVFRAVSHTSPPKATDMAPAPRTAQTNQVVELQKKLAQQNREMARLKSENKALWDGLSNTVEATTAPVPKAATDENATGSTGGARFGKMIKAAMKQQVEMKMTAMKSRLNLTDEQAQMVRELLEKHLAFASEMASKMFEEKTSREELQQQGKRMPNLDVELEKILTPEQWAGYQVYQVEERQQQAQAAASAEIMQIQSMLHLSAQQREQVQGILAQQLEQQLAADTGGATVSPNLEQYLDAKKEAVRAVLTPEQQQSYETFIETQREMFKSLLGGANDQTPAR